VRENFPGESAEGCFVFDEENRLANAWRLFRNGSSRFSDGRARCFLLQAGLGCRAIERLELRRREKLSGENRGTPGCPLNLIQLFGSLRIIVRGGKKKFRVDLDDGEEVIQLVCDEAGGFVGFLQRVRAGICLDGGLLLFGRTRAAGGFLQARISSIWKARLS
jgi:hypothetical protein